MSVSKPFVLEAQVPAYQLDAIEWLKGYKNTQRLQETLRHLRFSQEELETYRRAWAVWLQPKKEAQEKIHRGIH